MYVRRMEPAVGEKVENSMGRQFVVRSANHLNVLLQPIEDRHTFVSVPRSLFGAAYVPVGT